LLAKFIEERILEYDDALEVITLNKVNACNIILARTSYINVAIYSRKHANSPIDEVLN